MEDVQRCRVKEKSLHAEEGRMRILMGITRCFLSANEFEKDSAFFANDSELRPSTSAHSPLSEE